MIFNKLKNDDDILIFVKEIGNILQNFNLKLNNLNVNMSDEEFKQQFKIKNNEIIKEMQNVLKNNNFNEKCFDFIKLILIKYRRKIRLIKIIKSNKNLKKSQKKFY